MSKIYKPNYKDGSIVNLMSSIKKALGGKSQYKPLKGFDVSSIADKNIILLVIDGLGYEYLKKYGKDSFLYKNLKGKMTSVFPATTASAMTAFSTGVPPQQHALTGWFVYLKELGIVSAILPFRSRAGNFNLSEGKIEFQNIYDQRSFFEDLKIPSQIILDQSYANSPYSKLANKGAKRVGFSSMNDFFNKVSASFSKNENKFVLAYWAEFDWSCHENGVDSNKTNKHFQNLDKKIQSLSKLLKAKNAVLIVTADHGLIDTAKEDAIDIKDHPKFTETLALPLSGDSRTVYCYVRPDKTKQFEGYVKIKFKKYCELHKSGDLVKQNYFGLFEPNPKLKDRIGDYALIMKEGYIMKDLLLGEKRNNFIGHHSGLSKEEMFVPLIVIE